MNLSEEHRMDFIRGLASAAFLMGLMIGVPLLLIFGVGWPLPKGVPSGPDAVTAIRTGAIPPFLILKTLSLVVWALWLQLAVGVGIELWAHLQGRVAPQVSFLPPFVQRLSSRLIGAALVISFSIQQPGMAMADNQELLAPTTIEMEVEQVWGLEISPANELNVGEGAQEDVEFTDAEPLVHTVDRRDSLRLLAERYLGDPNRWTEVFVLNQGHAQAVGGSLTDPARLQPGWELVMPTDARRPAPTEFSLESAPATSQPTTSHQVEDSHITVKRGDTLWGLAAHHLNDPKKWVDIYDTNQEIIQDPSVIVPGWQLQLPAQDHESLLVEPAAPVTEPLSRMTDQASPVMAYATAPTTVVARVPATEADGPSAPNKQSMFAVGGLGVFASSLGWVLARLRRTQRRRLPNGRMPPLPSSDGVRFEQQLEAASDPESALFLDASLRVLSSRMAGCTPVEIIGASLNSAGMSIHLGVPSEAPPGFDASEDSMSWHLPRGSVLEPLLTEADGVPAPIPALAAMGKTDGREFLLNLEHVGALNLQGNPEAISSLCSAMATQLASSHLADDLTVLCVGFDEDLAVFERVEYVPDVAAAIERIAHLQRQNRALLGSHSLSAGSRIGRDGDYWHPTVTLVPDRLSEHEATGLREVCGSSVCIVAHGLRGATWTGQFDEHGLLLQPVGIRLEPHGLSDAAVATIAELTASAKDLDGVTLAGPPTPNPIQPEDNTHPPTPPPVDVEVRVLGTVDVLGAAHPFTSRRALDLVAYLAFHPEGADRDQLRTHIWPPDDPPTESTLANTVSRARKALGVNDHDEPYLPRVSSKGIYQLRPEVGTDVRRFEALVSAARADPSQHGRQQLEAAFELIRGTPFTGGAGDMFRWADFGLRTQIDCLVDTTAHELARRCIDDGEADRARHAVMTSLRLVGVCEQCYRWRLMAASENPTEIRQIMSELMSLLRRDSDQPEADDLISPELLELYERLMSGQTVFS